jgi:hypothetical protein
MSQEKVFAQGFLFKRKETAPEFVIGQLSIKSDEAMQFIEEHTSESGWINLNIMTARTGNYYIELDTFVPSKQGNVGNNPQRQTPAPSKAQPEQSAQASDTRNPDDLPF